MRGDAMTRALFPPKMRGIYGMGNKLSGKVQIRALELILLSSWSQEASSSYPEHGEVPAKRLAKATGCTLAEAEAVLEDTCKRGLAVRVRDPEDENRWLYKLTPRRWRQVRHYEPEIQGSLR